MGLATHGSRHLVRSRIYLVFNLQGRSSMLTFNIMGLTRYRAPYGAATQVSPCAILALMRASALLPSAVVRKVVCNKRDYSHPTGGMSHHTRPGKGQKRSILPCPLPFVNGTRKRVSPSGQTLDKPGRSWPDTTMPHTVPTAMSQSLPPIGRLSSLLHNLQNHEPRPAAPTMWQKSNTVTGRSPVPTNLKR